LWFYFFTEKQVREVGMIKVRCFVLLFFLLCSAHAFAEGGIGVIKTVEPELTVLRDGVSMPGEVGMVLMEHDVLKTGSSGAVGVVMNDDTTLSLGPGSELSMEEYVFRPNEGAFSVVLRMVKGTFVYMSGLIGKLSPDSIRLETPDSTIAVRGTRLLIKVKD
jgi:hypothetical protein